MKTRLRPDDRFYDYEDYLYFHFVTPPRWDEILTLRFRSRRSLILIVMLWLAAIGLPAAAPPDGALRAAAARLRPLCAAAPRLRLAAASRCLRSTQSGCSSRCATGEIDHPVARDAARAATGSGDRHHDLGGRAHAACPRARAEVARRLCASPDQRRRSIRHALLVRTRPPRIPTAGPDLGELPACGSPASFAPSTGSIRSPIPTRRSSAASACATRCRRRSSTLLRREGLDARIVQLNGHTVVTAEVDRRRLAHARRRLQRGDPARA